MDSIGSRLKKAREEKSLTLDDAQKSLKIHPRILKALEEDNAHETLSPVYVRSFLKSYARYLGLDAEKIVEDYSKSQTEEIKQVLHIEPKKKEIAYPQNSRNYVPLVLKTIVILLVAIFGIMAIIGTTRFIKRSVAKIADARRMHRENAAKEKLSGDSNAKKTKSVERSKPAPAVAVEKSKPSATVEKPVTKTPQAHPFLLVTKTSNDVWMEIKADGKQIFKSVLPKGSVEAWRANKKIELWVGKAESVELILNGTSLGSPGKGVKKGILITPQGMKIP